MSPRVGLKERSEDLGVLPEVRQESITAPAPHHLHCFYGETQQQIKKGCSNLYSMTLKRFQTSLTSSRRKTLDEGVFGERSELTFVLVGEEMICFSRAINPPMIF